MKKYTLLLSFTFCFLGLIAQNSWFKFVPGWQAQKSIITNDTFLTFGTGDLSIYNYFLISNSTNNIGDLLISDSFDYKKIIKDNFATSGYWISRNNPIFINNNLFVPLSVAEKVNNNYKNQIHFYNLRSNEKLPVELNQDTNNTYNFCNKTINEINYIIIAELNEFNKDAKVLSFQLAKFDGFHYKVIKSKYNDANSIYGHIPYFENIHADKQNGANLYLQILDRWDFHGVPAQFEAVIQKIDTTGKLIWESRPTGDQDTINTTDFQMVQLPNGNILCAWLDHYYRPYKKPGDPYQYELPNKKVTIWFAEIDNQTGKKLWVKNNRQFLDWKMGTTSDELTLSQMTDALSFDDGIVWCGYRYIDRPYPQNWTAIPYLYKTDFSGSPIWYREYNLATNDTTDKGFKPYSFIRSPDNGFLLTGEYMRRWGVPSDTTQSLGFFQTAALLKLDSNGCFTPGCNATDNIIKIIVPENNCNVYPNPANTFLIIEYPKGSDVWEILITDLKGKVVLNFQEKLNQISTANLLNGTYFIQLTNKKQYHYETHKITILH